MKVPLAKIITDTEYAINGSKASSEKKEEARHRIAEHLKRITKRHSNSRRNLDLALQRDLQATRDFLKAHDHLLILKADKGNATVVMERAEYRNKILNLLQDESTYKVMKKDPTASLERKTNEVIKEMFEKKYIDFNLKRYLTCYDSVAPKIYGLPKIHKAHAPLRPIVSFIKAPTYRLSQFIAEILNNLKNDNINVRSSSILRERMKNINVDPDYSLVSFDAVSLFTAIPVSLALEVTKERWQELSDGGSTALDEEMFFRSLEMCLKNGYCQYEGEIYSQIEGVGMGSPLSPIIAELVLDKLFECIGANFDDKIKFMTKYVDDSLFYIHNSIFDDLLSCFNKFHQRLKFTYEKENNSTINFLDLSIMKRNDKFIFRQYSKPTHTGRFINFQSNQPLNCKVNTAINLKNTYLSNSDRIFHKEIINDLKSTLHVNGYPRSMINNVIKKHKKEPAPGTHVSQKKFFSIPYVGRSSMIIRKHLLRLDDKISISFSSHNTGKENLFSLTKDKTPKEKRSGVVYSIPCSDCPQKYIGETRQHLKTRVLQHEKDVRKGSDHTALSSHALETGHKFSFIETKIVGTENNDKKRKILEVVNILKEPNAVNFKTDSQGLSNVYTTLIRAYHNG